MITLIKKVRENVTKEMFELILIKGGFVFFFKKKSNKSTLGFIVSFQVEML